MARQDVVRCIGLSDTGDQLIDVHIRIPEVGGRSSPVSENQLESLRSFYSYRDFEALTWDQAHGLLCFRDYARGVTRGAYPQLSYSASEIYASFAAAYISQDDGLAKEVERYIDRRFRNGADDDTLVSSVKRTKNFERVAEFVAAVMIDQFDWPKPPRPEPPPPPVPMQQPVRATIDPAPASAPEKELHHGSLRDGDKVVFAVVIVIVGVAVIVHLLTNS